MANHPISLVSPIQVIQASIARNNDTFETSEPFLPPTGAGDYSTTSVEAAPGNILTDNYAMQANDSTAFIFGSTASEEAPSSSDYTTVDDATKLATRTAIENDLLEKIKQEERRKKNTLKKNTSSLAKGASLPQEIRDSLPEQEMRNSLLVASHGRV